jgi:hypothetical protein
MFLFTSLWLENVLCGIYRDNHCNAINAAGGVDTIYGNGNRG